MCTSSFGRGSDFVCHDASLNKAGGVHVIQGRTARQGKNGSWSLTLDDTELASLDPKTWEDPDKPGAKPHASSASLNVATMQALSATERLA